MFEQQLPAINNYKIDIMSYLIQLICGEHRLSHTPHTFFTWFVNLAYKSSSIIFAIHIFISLCTAICVQYLFQDIYWKALSIHTVITKAIRHKWKKNGSLILWKVIIIDCYIHRYMFVKNENNVYKNAPYLVLLVFYKNYYDNCWL